jgi:uncharacterized OsmC-like protein
MDRRPALSPQRAELIGRGLRAREQRRGPATIRAINRIEINIREGLSYQCRNLNEPTDLIAVDEPVERGGSGDGASPLSHFLTGAGTCLLNQFVRIAIAEGMDLEFTKALVRGEFRREPGGAFERIVTEVHARGTLTEAEAARLVARAENLCYVHNTLKKGVEVSTVLHLGGRELFRTRSQVSSASD